MRFVLSYAACEKILVQCSLWGLLTLMAESAGWHIGLKAILFLGGVAWLLKQIFVRSGVDSRLSKWIPENATEAYLGHMSFILTGLILFWHLLMYQSVVQGQLVLKNANLNGDWPLHLAQIQHLVATSDIWPENPHLSGELLHYSFGVNWLQALMIKAGLSLGASLLLLGGVLFWVALSLAYRWMGYFGVLLVFVSGGGWGLASSTLMKAWGPGSPLATKSFLMAIYMPQRGFWLALPAGLFLLRWWWHGVQQGFVNLKLPNSFFIIWALLPWFHLHTFFIVTLLFAVSIPLGLGRSQIAKAFIISPLPIFFLLKSVNRANVESSVRFEKAWMGLYENSLFQTWWTNWGGWMLLWGLLAAWSFSSPRREYRWPYAIALGSFLLFSHLILAPWIWDQIKIMLWLFFVLGFFAFEMLQDQSPWFVRVALIVGLTGPAFTQFVGGLPVYNGNTPLWSLEDELVLKKLLQDVPVTESILIAADPHHPFWSTGYKAVSGFEGHLWSHGIFVTGLKDTLIKLVKGEPIEDEHWKRLKPKYLIWGPYETRFYAIERPPEEAKWITMKTIGKHSLMYRAQ